MFDYNEEVDNFLEHHGVKGMKWGRRKSPEVSGKSAKPKKLTRKEVKAEKNAYYQKKAKNMLDVAMKDPTSLIATVTPTSSMPTVMSGREFTNYLSSGGQFNIKYSQIYATKEKPDGPYVLRERERFVRSDKVKK